MKKDSKHYKFVNNETGNVIYLLAVPKDHVDIKAALEITRHQLAIENGIYIGSVYYIEVHENTLAE